MEFEQNHYKAEEEGYIRGELLYTIFHNETEHFSIAKIKILETNEPFDKKEIVVKGHFPKLMEGTNYIFYGTFENHSKFGMQYHVTLFKTYVPTTKDGLIQYLSSDLFYGIGKKTAKRIVDQLGQDAVRRILEDPSVLSKIPKLNKKTIDRFVNTLKENQGFEHVVVYLTKYGISMHLAQKMYDLFGEETIEQLKQDPYQFVFEIDGFNFHTADELAKVNGLTDHPSRVGAGCVYILEKNLSNGHVYLPLSHLMNDLKTLLAPTNITEEFVMEQLETLNKEKKIIVIDGKVYLPSLYYAEDGVVSHLKRIIEKPIQQETTKAQLMKLIGQIEEDEIISYGEEQFKAIEKALHSKVMILTGGPGTGKTTVIKGIIKAYAALHDLSTDIKDYDDPSEFPFLLAAPTGRAAKRLQIATEVQASTIHRLLGWDGNEFFEKNEYDLLQGKILIVDEFSMVDILLANHLFKAIPDHMQVLLVGDEDQLPSVGPGQVLTDLLEVNMFPSVTLEDVYRQQEGSKIIELAHVIKKDMITVDTLENKKDFSFIPCTVSQVKEVIVHIIKKAINKGIDPKDIQVLAPMYRTQAGIFEINQELQRLMNPKAPNKKEIKVKDVVYRIGDKVIQLVNKPEDGISNGDIGEIVAIFEEDESEGNTEQMVVSFEGKEVAYERGDYLNLMHAYCISIHKSQGSEFPIVILPVVSTYHRMLRKNLLYTAITRSKQSLIICGNKQAFLQGVQTVDVNKRYTNLKKLILKQINSDYIQEKIDEEEEDLSPYDFMEDFMES